MKRLRHITLTVLAVSILAAPSAASAATLDFTEVGATGIVPLTVINLSNATLTSFGNDMFIGAPGAFGDTNLKGIVCASPVVDATCEEDLQIDFFAPVTNLSFKSFAATAGDSVTVSAFLGAAFLGSTVVTTDTLVNFTALGAIDRLFFADASTAAGIGWGDFNFDTAQAPEPTSMALLGLGVAGALVRRRLRSPR